jgi:hypothetical protein
MATGEATVALIWVDEPDGEKQPTLRASWQSLKHSWSVLAGRDPSIQLLGPSAALLPMPSSWTTLARFSADAQQSGLRYTVRLFGPPVLTYDFP